MENEEELVEFLIEHTGNEQSLIGDDCAIIEEFDPPLLMTMDTMNESVHFDESFSPADVGRKLVTMNISDIASMGGIPRFGLLSLSASNQRSDKQLKTLYEAIIDRLEPFDATLAGGDFTRPSRDGCESLVLNIIGQAHSDGILRRDRARPGDRLAVTGSLGTAGAILFRPPSERTREDLNMLVQPPDRIALGQQLVEKGVQCAIDLSDGLAKDLPRICKRSGVGARIESDRIPVSDRAKKYAPDEETAFRWAVTFGEDFELLFTIPNHVDLGEKNELITEIGTMTDDEGSVEWSPPGGDIPMIKQDGYDHFQQ